jgi:hypothetical protein
MSTIDNSGKGFLEGMKYLYIYLGILILLTVQLIAGLVLVANPYVEYLLQICVTYSNGHVSCSNRVVRSFKLPLFRLGVGSVIISIIGFIASTIVIIILSIIRKRRRIIVNDVNNK